MCECTGGPEVFCISHLKQNKSAA